LECKYCGEKDGEYAEIPLTGKHNYDNACDTKCNVCGKTRSTTHIYKWVIDKKVTCYENGIKHEECVECGDKRNTNTIVKAYGGHVYSHIADKYCDLCGEECEVIGQHLIEEDGETYYYVDGEKSDITSLVKINGKWHYIKNGKFAQDATTLVKYNGTWYYVKNGVKNTATTLVKYGGKWYYVEKGVKKSATKLVKYGSSYYYVKSGKWDSSAKGIIKISGKYYYIKGGKWSKTTTLYKKSGKYYAVKSGMWYKSKAIIKYSGKKYYVNKGYAQTKYSGKVTISGKKYTVKKGIVK
jgi:glucan-binding YG repeat protein